jgi:translation elongation factor EF-4
MGKVRRSRSRGAALDRRTQMREYGNVSIPQEAFIAALRMGEE